MVVLAAHQMSIKGAYTARTLFVRSCMQNIDEEELAQHVVGNDIGMYEVVTHTKTHNKAHTTNHSFTCRAVSSWDRQLYDSFSTF